MKSKSKLSKDAKIALCLFGAFFIVVLMYLVNGVYSDFTGEIETEYILNYSEYETLKVNGFAVRDESKTIDGKNTSVLYKNDDLVYVPIISDSENVSKNGVIAVAFSTKAEADAYSEEILLREKLASIKELERSEELSHSNIIFLNSQISSDVASYISAVSSCDMDTAEAYIDSISKNITSKQIAIGDDLDYKAIIGDYNKKIKELKSSYTIVKNIISPYAGYFVSSVDGYEQTFSYDAAEDKKIEVGQTEKLLSASAADTAGAYGKIIAQHTWYYIFDTDINDAASLKTGYWVKVSFDEIGINDINMQVYDISDTGDKNVTVTLRCTSMNEELSKIRKDPASITLNKHSGFKISNEALTENESGVTGVYALVGNVIKFAPIEVSYYADDYVIAAGLKMLRDEDDKTSGYYHELKLYDKIIVKGRNLEDGNIAQ